MVHIIYLIGLFGSIWLYGPNFVFMCSSRRASDLSYQRLPDPEAPNSPGCVVCWDTRVVQGSLPGILICGEAAVLRKVCGCHPRKNEKAPECPRRLSSLLMKT